MYTVHVLRTVYIKVQQSRQGSWAVGLHCWDPG